MRKDQLAFLVGGLLFGVLLGFGLAWSIATRPGADLEDQGAAVPSPAGPMAATQAGPSQAAPPSPSAAASGGAPMMQEINALKTAIQADPKNLAAWTRLGIIYHDASMFDQAIPYYEKAVALAPDDPDVVTDLGVCLQEVGRYEEAVSRFREAQAADPSHWQSLYNLVVVEGLALHRVDAALETLAKLEKNHPEAPNLAELRASLEASRSRPAAGAP